MFEITETTAIILGTLFTIGVTIIGFIWKSSWWLSDQFRSTREVFFKALQELEDKFDVRHEANVIRFATLETKIDIAIKNGKH